jgi:hypothetical protein
VLGFVAIQYAGAGEPEKEKKAMRVLWSLMVLVSANGLSQDEFEKLRRDCAIRSAPWGTIPWEASLTRARARALSEKKPIFMMVDTGHPVGRG